VKKQLTLATSDFERFRKPTRREKFLAEMNTVVPWAELVALIEPYYPQATSAGGRPPVGLERMLRMHCLQLWFDARSSLPPVPRRTPRAAVTRKCTRRRRASSGTSG
jgi:hypothetical protein